MRFPRYLAGFFALTLMAFAAEQPAGGAKPNVVAEPGASGIKTNVVSDPGAGGFKTNVITGPSANSNPNTILMTETLLPAEKVFDGAPFKVFLGNADVTGQVLVPASDPKKLSLKFEPGQVYLLVRSALPSEPEKAVRGRRALPVALGGIGRSKDGAIVPFHAQVYFTYGRVPMAWDQNARNYASALNVFYVVEPEAVTPPPNFSAVVRFEATNATVAPSEVTMTPTEQSQRVMVRTPSFERPVIVAMKIDKYEFKSIATVAGELGTLRLTASDAEIAGFGAGQTKLRVDRFDPLERPLNSDEALAVSFTVEGAATLTPAAGTIPAGASGADVVLKSTGAGLATVTAKTLAGPTAAVKIRLRSILGGLVLRSDLPEITGFGAGQTDLRIQRVDPTGAALVEDKALNVALTVTGPGAVTPATATIPAGASEVVVRLKSTGFGIAKISATAADKTSPAIEVVVRSVLGGLKLTTETAEIADFGAGQTELRVQRLDPNGAPLTGEEALPVTFAITGAAKLTPATVTIPAGESSVAASLKSSGEGAVAVTATAGAVTSEPVKVTMTKTTHRLRLTPEHNTVLGMGLGRAKIAVTRQDAVGKDFADANALSIPLEISGPGVLETPALALKSGEVATTLSVKGNGLGIARLKVNGPIPGNEVEIDFVAPWALAVAAIVGSLLGAASRHVKTKHGVKRPMGKLVLAGLVATGVSVMLGLLGAWVGVIPQFLVASPGGAFALGGILGFAGTYIFDLFQTKEDKSDALAPQV